jgi:hypothetical protein
LSNTTPLRRRITMHCLGLLAMSFVSSFAVGGNDVQSPKRANFEREQPSAAARQVANWVVDSGDSARMPFVIVDKIAARVFVFTADGQLRGAGPALLGFARGDDSVPGIGERALSTIRPEERTTPAGRFVAALGRNMHGVEILWVDYDAAISMHPVVTGMARERRSERLASLSASDNRISFGCINVAAQFYANVILPTFSGTAGIVYVLPETKPARDVFALYDVEDAPRERRKVARASLLGPGL